MKSLIITLCLISTVAFAQTPMLPRRVPPQGGLYEMGDDALPENYLLKLIVKDKDQQITELSVVVATAMFRADTFDPTVTLTGALAPEDNGSILVRYTLSTEIAITTQTLTPLSATGQTVATDLSTQYKSGSVKASVRLRVGEPIQILKSGTRTYQLTVSRLAESAKKDK